MLSSALFRQVFAFGVNSRGQLGDGTRESRASPETWLSPGFLRPSLISEPDWTFDTDELGESTKPHGCTCHCHCRWAFPLSGPHQSRLENRESKIELNHDPQFTEFTAGEVLTWGANGQGQLGDAGTLGQWSIDLSFLF